MQALEYSPVDALEHCPGVVALLPGRTHRVARSRGSLHRVATDMDCCGSRINLAPTPRTPHQGKTRPLGGKPSRLKGAAIDFRNAGVWGVCQKPGDQTQQHPAKPRGTKRWCLTGLLKSPRVMPFLPRVGSFLPRVGFCVWVPIPLSISLFSLRKRGERGGGAGKRAIHGFLGCLKKHPRVCMPIHGFSGDEKRGRTQCWRGFAGCLAPIHASTGRNAYTFLGLVRNGR